MKMIPQDTTGKQQETLKEVMREVPIVLFGGETEAFILVKDLREDMEEYILTGKASTTELRVFTEEYEQELIRHWDSAGFEHKYRTQPFDYMDNKVDIKYLQVSSPCNHIAISLIPWFMLPDRPYPIFAYVYANWHYDTSKKKSMRLSAIAAGKLFGIKSFSKSTVSRSNRVMEQLISSFQIDRPLSVKEPDIPSSADAINSIPKLLNNCPAMESLTEACGVKTGQLPPPVRSVGAASHAFSNIPNKLSKVFKSVEPTCKQLGDTRKRPARDRGKRWQPVQQNTGFVEPWQIERIRLAFIALCKANVLDAAVSFHRFLI